jgi:hypothetical protein
LLNRSLKIPEQPHGIRHLPARCENIWYGTKF